MNHCHRNESHKEEPAWMLTCFLEPMGIPKNGGNTFFRFSPSVQSVARISLLKASLSGCTCLASHVDTGLSLVCSVYQLCRLHLPSCLGEVQVQIAWI